MMGTIININKLVDILPANEVEELETGAAQHLRFSNIRFKIIKVFESELHVRTEQRKSIADNYADTKTLIARTRELFTPALPDKTIHVHPIIYNENTMQRHDI